MEKIRKNCQCLTVEAHLMEVLIDIQSKLNHGRIDQAQEIIAETRKEFKGKLK